MRVILGGSGHLPVLSENGVVQILHMCSVVYERHAVNPEEGSLPPELQSAFCLGGNQFAYAATVLAPVDFFF